MSVRLDDLTEVVGRAYRIANYTITLVYDDRDDLRHKTVPWLVVTCDQCGWCRTSIVSLFVDAAISEHERKAHGVAE